MRTPSRRASSANHLRRCTQGVNAKCAPCKFESVLWSSEGADSDSASNCFDDRLRIRKFSGLQLRVNDLSVNTHFKTAAPRGNKADGANTLFKLEQFFRQTDGLW